MKPRALVVGLGIAGMASAISLKKNGWEPVIVERAPERRTGGYFIGLQDVGKAAADELGVLKEIHIRTPENSQNWHLTKDGSRVRVAGFADQATKPATLLRGDIEEGLWSAVDGQIEVRFATTPVSIVNEADKVRVSLQHGDGAPVEEVFDLVVGADGLRSTVRKLVFGPHEKFMYSLGAIICAYQLEGQMQTFRKGDGIILNEGRRSLWVFPLQDHTPTALFTYRTKDIDAQFKKPAVETLREVYKGMDSSGVVDEALEDLQHAGKNYLFDSVHEVRMPKWTTGRVVLVGDSAWCLTLYSGMGASAAIVGGYELGAALSSATTDIDAALDRWDAKMRPFTEKQRKFVRFKSQIFVPSNMFFFVLRRIVLRLGGRYLAKLSQEHKAA
ncbi:FAD-dependent monooxygenase [Rhizobium pusense]|uniref:FAD-dependent monooxygenase n=1 Tax=Agrobacterium pusense TaxID=648995 RepID=UPI0018E59521|nr:FAD-dependent monooxygenase [Agrobacterium pusense]MDH0912839.1 FAD-dependent monooxygenase [Agrobacterium pusense]MDH1099096.1 FAD-dependent monooxygenase [Agrobacterium pusense]MDH1115665.1 FAD-dependent monooxygenase [Agrobacterium pusense]MDH2197440.1 FAD-dependent monooxygenase [Agrobacterium pusense]